MAGEFKGSPNQPVLASEVMASRKTPPKAMDTPAAVACTAVQATAAGVSMALGGVLRDAITSLASTGWLGEPLNSPATGYSFVFHLEIYFLFVVLIALGPLVRRRQGKRSATQPMGLAELPG